MPDPLMGERLAACVAAGSAGAYRLSLATRTVDLPRAALHAWLSGIPERVIAADGRLPRAVVHGWIAARFSAGHPDDS
ncbi:hypothetical protein [Streptomyces sp. NPDC086766]|uniref:hypothetical protein n=1 Tax=Streptomyces sp. NPDC086766 TaxID=3365754 RepID=UPI0038275ED9